MRPAQAINMSCGQTDLYPECLEAMGTQLGSPIYYPPYREHEVRAIDLLKELLHTRNDVLLPVGTATYGEEACLVSAVEPGQKVLTVNTGTFGQVLTDIARIVGAEVVEIKRPMGEAVEPAEVAEALAADPDIKLVAVVQSETSAGTLNHVDRIGQVLRDFPGVLYLVDAVSSLAAMEIRVDDWGIDFLCSSPQKCVNAPQGLAIVVVSPKGWRAIEGRATPINTLCLDLTVWRRYHNSTRAIHETGVVRDASFSERAKAAHGPSPSWVLVKALRASLEAIFEEGPENVYRRHRVAGRAVRDALRAMGLGVMARKEEDAAPQATRIVFPRDLTPEEQQRITKLMWEKHSVAIGGQRIGTMGFVASPKYVLPTIHALEQVLSELGFDVKVGAGVAAASAAFAAGEECGRRPAGVRRGASPRRRGVGSPLQTATTSG